MVASAEPQRHEKRHERAGVGRAPARRGVGEDRPGGVGQPDECEVGVLVGVGDDDVGRDGVHECAGGALDDELRHSERVGRRRQCGNAHHVEVGGVVGGDLRRPERRVPALRVAPQHHPIRGVRVVDLAQRTQPVESRLSFADADEVGVASCGTHAGVVGRNDRPTPIDHARDARNRMLRQRVRAKARRARAGDPRGSVLPGQQGAALTRRRGGGQRHHGARDRGRAVGARRGVEDAQARRAGRRLTVVRGDPQQLSGLGRHRARPGVKVVDRGDPREHPGRAEGCRDGHRCREYSPRDAPGATQRRAARAMLWFTTPGRGAQRAPHQSQAGDRDRGRDDPREQQQTDVGPEPHEHGRGDVRGGEHSVGDPIGHRTGARGLGSRGAVRAERPHE